MRRGRTGWKQKLAGVTTLALVSTGLAAATAAGPLVRLEDAAATSLPPAAVPLGRLASATPLTVDVTLSSRDPAGLLAFVSQAGHPFLRPASFAARFGASPTAVAGVEALLRRAGLTGVRLAADHLDVRANGRASAVSRAFAVTLERYRLPSGRALYANDDAPSVPAAIAGAVQDVLGLDDLTHTHSLMARARADGRRRRAAPHPAFARSEQAGPKPCAAAVDMGEATASFTADQLGSRYGMAPLYALGDLGQGVRIALAEFEPNLHTDTSAYATCYGVSPSVNYVPVDGGSGTGPGTGEAALDIEDVTGLAPDATIDVYQGPTAATDQDTYDVYSTIFDDDVDQVVSTSWGQCEQGESEAFAQSEQTLFEQAAAQGQTVFAAAGDEGSTDCYGEPGGPSGSTLAVDDPGSQPFVLSVGGTSLGPSSETVWNDSDLGASEGAGGGGDSARWCMPAYQDQPTIPDVDNVESATCSGGGLAREVPDVSADADPETGYVVYFQGGWTGGVGGTSAAAPLWAAAAALVDDSPFCAAWGDHDPGVLSTELYGAVAANEQLVYGGSSHEALYDVTSGNDDFTPSGYRGGMYSASPGFDQASGLGTPMLSGRTSSGTASAFYPGLAALLCWQAAPATSHTVTITGVSPSSGSTLTPTTVTVTGAGFLPVTGADELVVGSQTVAASCPSSTSCTATLPAGQNGAVDLRMEVEDLAESAVTPAGQLIFGATPEVTVTSPALAQDLSPTVSVRYGATDPASPVASYDVRYRTGSWNSQDLSAYQYPPSWQATTATAETLPDTAGSRYCFDVRARSAAGVTSAWSTDRCTTVPLGASALRPVGTGWTRSANRAFYLGAGLVASREGTVVQLPDATAGRVALIVEGCTRCGTVRVTMGAFVIGAARATRPGTVPRLVLTFPPFAPRRGTITVTVTSSGFPVTLEGIAIS